MLHLRPLFAIKQLSQYKYNKSKGGLDKNTEISKHIAITTQLQFEPSYVLRMLTAIKLSQWRVEIGCTIVKPLVLKYQHDGKTPTATRIRKAAHKLSFDDFVYDSSIKMLVDLQTLQLRAPLLPAVAGVPAPVGGVNILDTQVSEIIQKRGRAWPVKSCRVKAFNSDALTRLRLHRSNAFAHSALRNSHVGRRSEAKKESRLSCAMCSKTNKSKNTLWHCSSCKVPLCTAVSTGETRSCFEIWHRAEDLSAAHERCHRNLLSHYAATGARKRRRQQESDVAGFEVNEEVNDSLPLNMADVPPPDPNFPLDGMDPLPDLAQLDSTEI